MASVLYCKGAGETAFFTIRDDDLVEILVEVGHEEDDSLSVLVSKSEVMQLARGLLVALTSENQNTQTGKGK